MIKNVFTRRAVIQVVTFGALGAASVAAAFGQDFGRARDLVARVQSDLQRAADFTYNNRKERDRYRDVQGRLSGFDRGLSQGRFDKGKLDDAINDLKDVVRKNTLESHDRDELARDLADLQTLRNLH